MTVTAPPARQLISNAVLAMLRAAMGCRVGDNRAPAFGGNPPRVQPDLASDYPYCINFDLDGGLRDGDWVDEMIDAEFAFQLSAIGRRRDQAQLVADKAAAVLVGKTNGTYTTALTDPAGMHVIRRTLDPPAGVMRDGSAEQQVWTVPVRFRVYVTGA